MLWLHIHWSESILDKIPSHTTKLWKHLQVAVTCHQPNVLAIDPPNTTESAIMSRALSIIGRIRLSYGPSILFLHNQMNTRAAGEVLLSVQTAKTRLTEAY